MNSDKQSDVAGEHSLESALESGILDLIAKEVAVLLLNNQSGRNYGEEFKEHFFREDLSESKWQVFLTHGYHWLKCKTEENSELELFEWNKNKEEFRGVCCNGRVTKEQFLEHWEYKGKCLKPDEISNLVSAERARCAALVKSEVTRLVGDKRMFLKKSYLRNVLKSLIQAIKSGETA